MKNDLDEFRPILRTIGALLVYLVAFREAKGLKGDEIIKRCYDTADSFLATLDRDLKAASER